MLVTGIRFGDLGHQVRIEVLQVRDLRPVELAVEAGFDLPGEIGPGRRHDDVVTAVAGKKLRFEHVAAVVDVVPRLDPRGRGEILECRLADVVRPVVDVQDVAVV